LVLSTGDGNETRSDERPPAAVSGTRHELCKRRRTRALRAAGVCSPPLSSSLGGASPRGADASRFFPFIRPVLLWKRVVKQTTPDGFASIRFAFSFSLRATASEKRHQTRRRKNDQTHSPDSLAETPPKPQRAACGNTISKSVTTWKVVCPLLWTFNLFLTRPE